MWSPQSGERWHDTPLAHMVAGPCPKCNRNTCPHQLPFAQGYVVATFDVVRGNVKEIVE